MIYLFSAAVLLVFFINFEVIGLILKRSARNFYENQKKGTAEVVGYDSSEQSRWYSLIVKIIELNDGKTYICNSAKINIHNYPKGKIIDVIYVTSKIAGKNMIQVYLLDNLPANKMVVAKVFTRLGYFILIVVIVLILLGIYSIL